MKKFPLIILGILGLLAFTLRHKDDIFTDPEYIAQLRTMYSSGDPTKWEAPTLDSTLVAVFQDIGSLPPMPFPADNPFSEDKKTLGKLLFFDPRLSRSTQISCASCHDSQLGWGDGRSVSFGHNRRTGVRNAMTILNTGYYTSFFWDGRAATLEAQALGPMTDPVEMHSTQDLSVKRIRKIKGYKPYFVKAFGDDKITIERITQAIATYERTIVSGKSKFDRFISGDKNRFTDEEVVGLHLFRTKARCINCHNTPLFSDNQFHNVGLSYYGRMYEDLGKYKHSKKKEDVGSFRTPSLREVARTAPYMHNGFMPDLEGIVEMYNIGMPRPEPRENQKKDTLFPTTDRLLQPLNLSRKEKEALVAFLKTLSSPAYHERMPELPK